MKLSPLQMAFYKLGEFSLSPRMGIDPEQESLALIDGMSAHLEIHEEEPVDGEEDVASWSVMLFLEFVPPEGDHSPYEFSIGLLGSFKCPKVLPSGLEPRRLVGVNGSSMLYGIARELIQTISEKSMWGRLNLPTMSFTNYEEMILPDDRGAADSDTAALAG
jgi:hypothetical protein